MNRRDFLSKFLLSAAGLYVAPKTLIFDMGAHKKKWPNWNGDEWGYRNTGLNTDYDNATHEEVILYSTTPFGMKRVGHGIIKYPRRFILAANGEFIEVKPDL